MVSFSWFFFWLKQQKFINTSHSSRGLVFLLLLKKENDVYNFIFIFTSK